VLDFVSKEEEEDVPLINVKRLIINRFYNDHGIYAGFGGIAFNPDEGLHIAEALGDTKGVILQNHGHMTVAKTVDGAAFLFGAMDRCIQAQLMADAACAGRGTTTVKVDVEAAEYTRKTYNDEMVYIMFQSA
jgi:ribulose-5-phosphate 4-epimerase/fuculose-1-phosphate aldolase